MRRIRWAIALLACATPIVPAVGSAQNGNSLGLSAESAVLVDADGRTLFAKNADVEWPPASLVKLMTLFLAFEDVERGRARLDDPVTVSPAAASTPRYRIGLRVGEPVALGVLLDAVAIASANDAATAVAEHLAGDEATFVARMNRKARELGLVETSFANPHGLPDPGQHSTARDLALLAARLFQDYPDARRLLGGQTFIYRSRIYSRHVPLFRDPLGVQALKTGFTHEAGYNLALSAWWEGHRVVMILLGSRSRSRSFLDAKRVLHFGFIENDLDGFGDVGLPGAPSVPARSRRSVSGG